MPHTPVKKGRGRPRKASVAKNKKKSATEKVIVAPNEEEKAPVISLEIEKASDDEPIFFYEEDPSKQLGDFLLVSPIEAAVTDLSDPSCKDRADPLSTKSLGVVGIPPSSKFINTARCFLLERKKEPPVTIPLNLSGDEVVSKMLKEAIEVQLSNKIGELGFRKKYEWICQWRKLRYPDPNKNLKYRTGRTIRDYDSRGDGDASFRTNVNDLQTSCAADQNNLVETFSTVNTPKIKFYTSRSVPETNPIAEDNGLLQSKSMEGTGTCLTTPSCADSRGKPPENFASSFVNLNFGSPNDHSLSTDASLSHPILRTPGGVSMENHRQLPALPDGTPAQCLKRPVRMSSPSRDDLPHLDSQIHGGRTPTFKPGDASPNDVLVKNQLIVSSLPECLPLPTQATAESENISFSKALVVPDEKSTGNHFSSPILHEYLPTSFQTQSHSRMSHSFPCGPTFKESNSSDFRTSEANNVENFLRANHSMSPDLFPRDFQRSFHPSFPQFVRARSHPSLAQKSDFPQWVQNETASHFSSYNSAPSSISRLSDRSREEAHLSTYFTSPACYHEARHLGQVPDAAFEAARNQQSELCDSYNCYHRMLPHKQEPQTHSYGKFIRNSSVHFSPGNTTVMHPNNSNVRTCPTYSIGKSADHGGCHPKTDPDFPAVLKISGRDESSGDYRTPFPRNLHRNLCGCSHGNVLFASEAAPHPSYSVCDQRSSSPIRYESATDPRQNHATVKSNLPGWPPGKLRNRSHYPGLPRHICQQSIANDWENTYSQSSHLPHMSSSNIHGCLPDDCNGSHGAFSQTCKRRFSVGFPLSPFNDQKNIARNYSFGGSSSGKFNPSPHNLPQSSSHSEIYYTGAPYLGASVCHHSNLRDPEKATTSSYLPGNFHRTCNSVCSDAHLECNFPNMCPPLGHSTRRFFNPPLQELVRSPNFPSESASSDVIRAKPNPLPGCSSWPDGQDASLFKSSDCYVVSSDEDL